jgi:outer membrane protein insertion porin family
MPIGRLPGNGVLLNLIIAGSLILSFASCTVVKKYPAGKPFVYKTNINLIGNFTSDDRSTLTSRLKAQLDDSMRPRSVSKLLWSVMKNPPVYDSANAGVSVNYMHALLISLGYFKDSIGYRATIDTAGKDEFRTTVTFDVKPGLVTRIDSFSYNIKHNELQKLALENADDALIKKGDPFAKASISLELDRLVDLYRNNGFMRFSREELIGLWDTLDISFLEPSLDPLEQMALLEKLKQRREHPTANLEIGLRPGHDTAKLKKFYIGNITVYPDITFDTTGAQRTETMIGGVKVIAFRNIFKPRIFPPNISLRHNDLYDQRNYFKTINRFTSLGPWRQVNIDQVPRRDQDTADFTIRLIPAKKNSFFANIEGSRNQNAVSGNLFGIAVNVGLQNRNFARAANQANTNFRFGVETGRDTATDIKFIQTRQLSFNHTIYFPRPIPAVRWIPENVRNSFRTVLTLNAATTERRELYNLNTVNGSWGYDFQLKKKQFTFRFPNIEYASFQSRPRLDTIFKYNPSLRNVFTDGFISSMIVGMNVPGSWKNGPNNLRLNLEISGLVSGVFQSKFLDTNLYRFLKLDMEFVQKFPINKSALVLHFFTGIGYEFNSTANPAKKYNLPFFREYFAGGPNSMRAWGLRKLGPGSTIKDFDIQGVPDRYGDLQLEANIEYRFPFIKFFGIVMNGALFTDIGNIWYVKKAPGRPPEEVFKFSRLGTDLAVGMGTGLRLDFKFFVIRMDYSIKAKDPSPSTRFADVQNKWFGYKKLGDADQFQLAISYPFIL